MRPAVVLTLLLLTAGCGADPAPLPDPVAQPSAVTGTPEPPPTAAPRPSPPAPSAAPPRRSAAPSPSAPARAVPAAQGDVDGDGEPDEIAYEGSTAVVTLSGGGQVRADTAAGVEGDEPPATAGVEDVDRDGRAEVFVRVGRGASTGFLAVLSYDDADLGLVATDDGPLVLAFGGSVGQGDGFSCTEDGTLVVRSAVREADDTYEVSSVTYAVDGRRAEQVDRTDRAGVAADDEAVAAAYVLDCRSVGEGD